MDDQNNSILNELFFQGLSDVPELQIPMFLSFLQIYLITLIGNFLIVIIICLDYQLHKPMYYFIWNLSFLDMSYASVTQPKLLSIFLMGNHSISYAGCITQLYFVMTLVTTEFFLLSAMAYDRYVAICKPLQYPLLINKTICALMIATRWVVSFLEPLSHLKVISQLPLCISKINHFYCDYSALLRISCINMFNIEVMTYVAGSLVGLPAYLLTLASYVYIISAILKIQSSEGRHKAFSTCVSHLTVVIIFYSTVLIMFMRPSSWYTSDQEKLMSLLYTTLIPLANPFIYTLRNKDVKRSLKKLLS